MAFMVTLYSKVYLENEDTSWSARPNGRLLQMLHGLNHGQGSARWIASLSGLDEGQNANANAKVRVALGDPVPLDGMSRCVLFVPQWILDSIGLDGGGEEVEIRFERSENMSKAVRLGFKIIGDIPRDIDIKELLEEPLSQLGVLEEGQMIPAPVLEGVCLLVQTCEHSDGSTEGPAFLDGADIALEIEEEPDAFDQPIETPPYVSRPMSFVTEQKEDDQEEEKKEDDDFGMLPSYPVSPVNRGGFIPFQGVGRRLGSS